LTEIKEEENKIIDVIVPLEEKVKISEKSGI
jgi:hypothetical protein